MATGGRILHHLRKRLPDERNTVIFVGFQAAGTRGRRLVDGEEEVRIFGEFVPVRAHIERLDNLSAHADSREILRWLGGFKRAPEKVFLVHGEPGAQEALKTRSSKNSAGGQILWKYRSICRNLSCNQPRVCRRGVV